MDLSRPEPIPLTNLLRNLHNVHLEGGFRRYCLVSGFKRNESSEGLGCFKVVSLSSVGIVCSGFVVKAVYVFLKVFIV